MLGWLAYSFCLTDSTRTVGLFFWRKNCWFVFLEEVAGLKLELLKLRLACLELDGFWTTIFVNKC
jgi:hypothetical protein